MKDFLNRLKLLIIKLISVKGVVWIIATIMLFMGIIDANIWFIISGIFVGIRTIDKYINIIPKKVEQVEDK